MDRDHTFTIGIPDGTYEAALLADARIESSDGTVTAHAGWLDVQASGESEAEALQKLLGEIGEQVGNGPGTPGFEAMAEFVRTRGRRLSDDEVFAKQVAMWRARPMRQEVTSDEHYDVPIFADAEIVREGERVVVRQLGIEVTADSLSRAADAFVGELNAAIGEKDAPGPRWDEVMAWIRARGERIPADVLAAERAEQEAYERSKGEIASITPDDIPAESSTGVPLLVDFWAEWCGPCKAAAPVLADLAREWSGRVVIRKIDVDQHQSAGDRFNFRGIPTMILFRDGEEVHRVTGFGGRDPLVKEFEPHLI